MVIEKAKKKKEKIFSEAHMVMMNHGSLSHSKRHPFHPSSEPSFGGAVSLILLITLTIESFGMSSERHPWTIFHNSVDTPNGFQFHTFESGPRSPPCAGPARPWGVLGDWGKDPTSLAGNSLRKVFGRARRIRASALEKRAPHFELVHTYSHPMMKNGFSIS